MNVELDIEELVLHGVAPGDRFRVGAALEAELARLIADRGLPQGLVAGGDHERLDGGAFQAAPDSRPEYFGMQAAQAVYRGLK